MPDNIKFVALGGLDENGKNMYCLEINDSIFVIEAGLRYPESQHLGIDIQIPTFDYLVANKDKVKAIFLTHAHPDTMGAITYLIKEVNIPIYTSYLTAWIVEDNLKRAKIKQYKLKRLNENAVVKIDDTKIHTFKTTHSIIQSFGLAFESKHGFIVYSSDYIIDFSSNKSYQTDMNKLVDIARKGVLLLMTESVSSANVGYTSPNHQIKNKVESIIANASNRIIVSAYTHSMYNIQEIVDVAVKYNYRVIFLNKELIDLVHKHEKLGDPIVDKNSIAPLKDINKGDVLVVISGNGSDLFEQLSKIATKADDVLKPRESDTFIIASPPIPGIESLAIKAIDDIYRLDSDVYTFNDKSISSMHASEEDIKMMISILKPKYYLPVKGQHVALVNNARIANNMGISSENIIVLSDGELVTFKDGKLLPERKQVETGSKLIDGQVINDDNGIVLMDRLSLSEEGTVIVGVGIDRKTKKIATSIDVQTRGFIYIKDSEYIIDEIRKIVTDIVDSYDFNKETDFNNAKAKIREKLSKYIYHETEKKPIVLSMIVTV